MTKVLARIAVIDIPILLDAICSHLDKTDLTVCRQVCRQWCEAFMVHLYAAAHLDLLLPASPYQKTVLQTHAGRVRILTTDISDGAFLAEPEYPCTRLQELHVVEGSLVRPFVSSWKYHPQSVPSAMDLIALNPDLRLVHVTYCVRLPWFKKTSVLESLATHQALRVLRLELRHGDDRGQLFGVLRFIPPTLEDLQVNGSIRYHEGAQPIEFQHEVFSLRKVYIVLDMKHEDRLLLLPLLEKTPHLTDLVLHNLSIYENNGGERILESLVKHCPDLEILHLRGGFGPGLCLPPITKSLQAMGPLRKVFFKVSKVNFDSHALISALLLHSGPTLEEVDFLKSVWIDRRDVLWLLEVCPQLRRLGISRGGYVELTPVDAYISVQDLAEAPWASPHMRALEIQVAQCLNEDDERLKVVLDATAAECHDDKSREDDQGKDARRKGEVEMLLRLYDRLALSAGTTYLRFRYLMKGDLHHGPYDSQEIEMASMASGALERIYSGDFDDSLVDPTTLVQALLSRYPTLSDLSLRSIHDPIQLQDLVGFKLASVSLQTMGLEIAEVQGKFDQTVDLFDKFFQECCRLPNLEIVQLNMSGVRCDATFKDSTFEGFDVRSFGWSDSATMTALTILFLTRYPKIKSLAIVMGSSARHKEGDGDVCRTGVCLQDLIDIQWNCPDLESLELTLTDDDHFRSSEGQKGQGKSQDQQHVDVVEEEEAETESKVQEQLIQQREIVKKIVRFHRKVMRQKHVQTLALKWSGTGFIMPRVTGMGHALKLGHTLTSRDVDTLGLEWGSL